MVNNPKVKAKRSEFFKIIGRSSRLRNLSGGSSHYCEDYLEEISSNWFYKGTDNIYSFIAVFHELESYSDDPHTLLDYLRLIDNIYKYNGDVSNGKDPNIQRRKGRRS